MESTFFAPAGRADDSQLSQQQRTVSQAAFITAMLNAVPDMMLILNEHRQIVAANKSLLSAFGVTDQSALVGTRPGEAVSCVHSSEGPDGCGTSKTCSVCGAVMTILASQETGVQAEGECRIIISRDGGTALDLEATATPIDIAGIPFTIFALRDIGPDKRRQVLERTFFHDILNTVGGISGIAGMLVDSETLTTESETEYKQLMVELSENLAEEIAQQRRLLSAERGEYIPDFKDTNLREMLQEVCKLYGNHIRTPDRTVLLEDFPEYHLKTDSSMLRRIVGNMVLNALEATPVGGIVRVDLIISAEDVSITVTNPGEISEDVQLSIFKRSFSTKSSSGRGIGTYSMKLFGERYLGGNVSFNCADGNTVFHIRLPI
ncbi:MAG: ATP-binding protein [Desulfuromonadales bacterium]